MFRTAPKPICQAALDYLKKHYVDVEIDYIGNVDWDREEKPFRNYYLLEYTGFFG